MQSGSVPLYSRLLSALMLVTLIIGFVLVTAWMDSGTGLAVVSWPEQPWRVLTNALPGLLLASFLLALTRRAVLSLVLVLLLEGLLYGINSLKVTNLGTPLLPADLYMVGQLTHGLGDLLGGYLPRSAWPYWAIVGGFVSLGVLAYYERPVIGSRARGRRLSLAGISAALIVCLIVGRWPWPQMYEFQRVRMQPWAPAATAHDMGLVNTLVLFHLYFGAHDQTPDAPAARRLLAQETPVLKHYMQGATGSEPRPDIVVVQSESFFDPAIMKGYEAAGFNPNLHRLARQGTSGFMQVPTFGGGTIRTEFEVLTGMSLRYLDGVQFPYLQIHQRVIPSLVRTLNDAGYRSIALHGADPAIWDRARAFRSMGFDQFLSSADFPADAPRNGRFMADSAMTDEILRCLSDDDHAPPQFVFAISIEAHGSYDVSPGLDREVRDAIPVPATVTDPMARLKLRNYLYHMRNADAELGRLVASLEKRRRPTLVVFYGDHLPGLLDAYEQTGFVDGRAHGAQRVPWLMLTTHGESSIRREDTTAWMLPGLILDRIGMHSDQYFALTQIVGSALESSFDSQGLRPTRGMASDTVALPDQVLLERGMASLTKLRLRGDADRFAEAADAPAVAPTSEESRTRMPIEQIIGYGVAP